MKKKLIIMIVFVMLVLSMTACSNEKVTNSNNDGGTNTEKKEITTKKETTKKVADEKENNRNEVKGLKKCGEIYNSHDLEYNVIGVRINEYADGVKYLVVNMEVFNHTGGDVNFSGFDRLTVFGKDDTEYMLDILAAVDHDLSGNITPDNKIMGEVAFEITDSKENDYVLHIGNSFEYQPAIEIVSGDIGMQFPEQFEGSGVVSEYTVGVPIESKSLTILLNDATVTASDQEGKEILLCDLSITNNTADSTNFMLGLNFDGVYTADGVMLDYESSKYTLQNDISGNNSITGIASFYIEEGQRDFYMTVTPDLSDYTNQENIVFSVE